jgi:hypothetical protein
VIENILFMGNLKKTLVNELKTLMKWSDLLKNINEKIPHILDGNVLFFCREIIEDFIQTIETINKMMWLLKKTKLIYIY